MSRIRAVLLSLLLLSAAQTFAQARNAAYVEVGGSAIVPSVNYERRVNERWHGRVGFSFVSGESEADSDLTFVVPLTASWVSHPSGDHHFEAGGGLTLIAGDAQDFDVSWEDGDEISNLIVTGLLGYRYQKPRGGFQFRAVLTPVVVDGGVFPWGGVSLGYAW